MADLTPLIIKELQEMGVDYEVVPGSEWVKCVCINPDHDDRNPSAGVNIESGVHYCFSCNHTEKIINVDSENMSEEDRDVIWDSKYDNLKRYLRGSENTSKHDVFLPPIDYPVTESWRGVSPELLQELGVYYCSRGKYRGRYVFPIYDKYGEAVSFDARVVDDTAMDKDAKWIRPSKVKVQELVYPYNKLKKMLEESGGNTVVVTEGIMDSVSYIEMNVPAIPSFGLTAPSTHRITALLELGVENIVLGFDNDTAGIGGTMKVYEHYAEWFNVISHPMVETVRNLGFKDCNDMLVAGKTGNIEKKEVVADEGWDNDDYDYFEPDY